MEKNHNYVISLTQAETRRNHIQQEFHAHNIPFCFFNADMQQTQLQQFCQQMLPELLNQPFLSDIEKSLFINHIRLWQKALDENLPFISVFEDDIVLGKEAELFLADKTWLHERFAPNDAYIVRFETLLIPVNTVPFQITDFAGRRFDLLTSTQGGAAGYLISRNAARLLLDQFRQLPPNYIQPIDILMFGDYLNRSDLSVLQVNPALCIQELQLNPQQSILSSQLEAERAANQKIYAERYRKRKSFKQRLLRALTKINREYRKRQQKIIPFK